MKATSLAPVTVALLASLCAFACSSTADDREARGDAPVGAGGTLPEGAEGAVEASEDELRASCTNPRRYFVTFREGSGTCEPIPGRRGQWLPEPLFEDAPADLQLSTCAYGWSGERYSRPDGDAIAAKVGHDSVLAPACGNSSVAEVGELQPIPNLDAYSHAGSVGCDVCGVLRNGKVWAILPPSKIASKQFAVQLTNGTSRAFQIEATDARALTITLPTPPRGTAYKHGSVHIY